ncbi:MAG: hypothetical protein DRJ67_09660 [Thermoprotei archaeon]|nr:MAG: hypothetical protein DRJ67_09660 [Thermoprotei archaeon]
MGAGSLQATRLLLTTVPGLEDLLLEEAARLLRTVKRREVRRGRVLLECSRPLEAGELSALLSRLALAEKAYVVLLEAKVGSLEEVSRAVRQGLCCLEDLLKPPVYFAVEAARVGEHPFTSRDIAREVGSVIQELKPSPPVSLDDPDVLLYAELIGDEFRLCVDLTPFMSLKDRGYRVYLHPSALNPIVARAMCRIARVQEGDVVVDPMCGSGTIIIECMLEAPNARGVGCDVNPAHVRGAALNARAAGIMADFVVADVKSLARVIRPPVDVVAANPPYGIREKAVGGLRRVYEWLFEGSSRILGEGGRLVMLSPLRGLVEEAWRRIKRLELLKRRAVEVGGLKAYIFLFAKR